MRKGLRKTGVLRLQHWASAQRARFASSTPRRVRGMHDNITPQAVLRRSIIEKSFRNAAEGYAFQEVETPIVEDTSLFLRTLGDASDVVGKEMYTFLDRSKASLSLRPEGTAGVMRAALDEEKQSGSGSGFGPQQPPRKLFYKGPMFRHERPQKGRYRQFTQLGVEYIGGAADHPLADAEVIALANDFLEDIGIADECTLRINTLGTAQCRERYQHELLKWLQALDPDTISESSKQKMADGRILRILDSKEDDFIVQNAPVIEDYLQPEARERHDSLLQLLDESGIPYQQDWTLVRGLDYYCHTAFEFVYEPREATTSEGSTQSLGAAQGTVLAGGRYDSLSSFLGWRGRGTNDVPAVGWAAGMERLELILPQSVQDQRSPPPVVTVGFIRTAGCATVHDDTETMKMFHTLCSSVQKQQQEMSAVSDAPQFRLHRHYAAGKMPQLLRACEGVGSQVLLLAGVDELAQGLVSVRDLRTREQTTVSVADAVDHLRRLLT